MMNFKLYKEREKIRALKHSRKRVGKMANIYHKEIPPAKSIMIVKLHLR